MQKKSLLTRAQETTAAQVPGANATEMTLATLPAGNDAIAKLMRGDPPLAAPYVSASSSTPYLFFHYGIGEGAEAAKKALPHLRKGDLVLVSSGKYTTLRSPVTLFLITAHQHWAERSPATQQLVKACLTPQSR